LFILPRLKTFSSWVAVDNLGLLLENGAIMAENIVAERRSGEFLP
jgi:hypothetical protein